MHKAMQFDLDGVLVDTAKYHFIAWKSLADELGIPFTAQDNERLKGVSRMRSLEIILEIGGRTMTAAQKDAACARKNALYLTYIDQMTPEEVLPGAREFLQAVRAAGYRTALGSASKNSMRILRRLDLTELFDAIVDGTRVTKAKPDPEVFTVGSQLLGAAPADCLVFEDAVADIDAAHAAGMQAVGIGTPGALPKADAHLPAGFAGVTPSMVESLLTV